jgi:hypothetical protein
MTLCPTHPSGTGEIIAGELAWRNWKLPVCCKTLGLTAGFGLRPLELPQKCDYFDRLRAGILGTMLFAPG